MTSKPDSLRAEGNAYSNRAESTQTPHALAQLGQALLAAQGLEDVLHASLEVLLPTDINGVSILLPGGPPDDRYLKIAAAWERDGQPTLPLGTRFSAHDYLFQPLLTVGQPVVVNDAAAEERVSEHLRFTLLQAGIGALVALPLGSGQDYFGAILIVRAKARPFSSENLHLYVAVAALATGTIEKLWLIQEKERELAKTQALYGVNRRLLACQSINEILHIVLDSELFGAAGGSIALLEPPASTPDGRDQELVFWAATGAGAEKILGMRMPVSEGVVGWVVRENEPALVPDAYADERFYAQVDADIDFRTHSILCAPLQVEGRAIGAIELVDVRREYLNREGLRLLDQVAQQVALFIENRRLLSETQRQAQDLTRLLQVGRDLASTLDREQAPTLITSRVLDLVKADGCHLFLLQATAQGEELLVPVASSSHFAEWVLDTPLKLGQGITGSVAQSGVGEKVNRSDLDPRSYHVPGTPRDPENLISVPLVSEGRVIGVMTVTRLGEEGFVEQDLRIVSALAGYAATVLVNARLFEEVQRLYERTESALTESRALYAASRALNQAQDLQGVLHAIVDNLPITYIDQCLIMLMDSASDVSTSPSAEIKAMWDHEGDYSLLGRRFTARELAALTQPETTETFVVSDLEHETRFDPQSIVTLQALGVTSALVIPLIVSGRLLGWLLLITHHPQTRLVFDADQIRPYQALADQAAVVIQNQALLDQLQASLKEVQTAHRQYLREAWTDFLQSQEIKQTSIAYDHGTLVPAQELWHPLMDKAVRQGAPVAHTGDDAAGRSALNLPKDDDGSPASRSVGASLVAPLQVRGQVIGALGLEDMHAEEAREWTPDDLSMVAEIAEQVALAIENARLLEQTQVSLAETERLYLTADRLSRAESATEVIDVLAQEVQTALGPDFSGSILQAGPDPISRIEWVEMCAQWNPLPGTLPLGTRLWVSDHPELKRFIAYKEPSTIRYADISPKDKLIRTFMARSGARCITVIPMIAGDSRLGAISVVSQSEHIPDERTLRFLHNLADRAALTLESIRLHKETQRRAVQLEAAAKVSRAATSILEQDELLSSVVELIHDHFDYYHAQVFLIDPTESWAVLEAATGKVGQRLLRRGHALEVGGPSLVGAATASGEPRIAHDVSKDPLHLKNDLLPNTRSEMVIPLKIGERVVGALDVQGTETDAFSPDDVSVLTTLADQLATAIENAHLYQEQLKTAAELREVDRLKSQFMANMSHELRTPLNSIIGFSRVMLKGIDGPLTDLQTQDLTAIYESGQHLLRLINDVLDLSRIEAGRLELTLTQVDLGEVIKGVMSTTAALVKDRPEIELRHTIGPELPPIRADATRVRQVLLNLLSNAIKFTAKGYVELSATHDTDYVTMMVSDTGVGIPPDRLHSIFKEFEQVDGSTTRTAGGTGLGLPISRHLVEIHGGSIWVESQVGVGSTFTVQLPITGPQGGTEETIAHGPQDGPTPHRA